MGIATPTATLSTVSNRDPSASAASSTGSYADTLVALPKLYTDLYARVKGSYATLAVPDYDPAVCLGMQPFTRHPSLSHA